MLYAWINEIKRAPLRKGEKTICRDCGGDLVSVIPVKNIRHWRHKAKDCDKWSEPEGEWHLYWKEHFDFNFREICLVDDITGEKHRADIRYTSETLESTVVELQHSNISEEERISREKFYGQNNRMFWLVHLHNDYSFNSHNFKASLNTKNKIISMGREFIICNWMSRSSQFIEKWKRSNVHVFFDCEGSIFYLANENISKKIGLTYKKGEFAVHQLTKSEFINAVKRVKQV